MPETPMDMIANKINDLIEASNSLEKRITEFEKDRADDNKEFYERLERADENIRILKSLLNV